MILLNPGATSHINYHIVPGTTWSNRTTHGENLPIQAHGLFGDPKSRKENSVAFIHESLPVVDTGVEYVLTTKPDDKSAGKTILQWVFLQCLLRACR